MEWQSWEAVTWLDREQYERQMLATSQSNYSYRSRSATVARVPLSQQFPEWQIKTVLPGAKHEGAW